MIHEEESCFTLLIYGVQSSLWSYFDKSKIVINLYFFFCLLEGLWIVR